MNSYKGAFVDNRKTKHKDRDYSYKEIAGKSTVEKDATWVSRSEAFKNAEKYDTKNQGSTSACGAYAGEMAIRIDTGLNGEPAYLYWYRKNFPNEGMFHYDLGNIMVKRGICHSNNIPTTEYEYNSYIPSDLDNIVANQYKTGAFILLNDDQFNIDDIAYILNVLKRPVILFTYWNKREWNSSEPKSNGSYLLPENAEYRHYVTAIPNTAYKYRGQKNFIILDSTPFGGVQQRSINSDWVKDRIYTGLYTLSLPKPEVKKDAIFSFKYKFTKDLTVGSSGYEVEKLQDALRELGFFTYPKSTGYFGGITRQAVKDFQNAYFNQVLQVLGLKKATGYWGASSRKMMNKLME